MKCRKDQRGFTLVEIAIVLVIIGLLLGAILKGQEMIKSAKIKRVVKQTDELRAASYTYQDLYKYLPGDDPAATTRWSAAAGNGNANGQIAGGENYLLFNHLQVAGLISGSYNGTSDYPTHAFGGNIWLVWMTAQGKTSHWFNLENLPGEIAQIIDTTYDDGIFNNGAIRGSAAYTNAAVTLYVEF
jgi:prepilin-type N-terminal cleavage/methylation domain-containing protein